MGNDRKTHLYPQLSELGIEYFGFYSHKTATEALKRHDHGSCYELCYLESGMQPYYIYDSPEASDEDAHLYRLYGGELFITHPHQLHSTGAFRQLRGRLYWIQLSSTCTSLLGHSERRSALLQQALASLDNHVIKLPNSVASRLKEAFHMTTVMSEERLFRASELLTLFLFELADCNRKQNSGFQAAGSVSSITIEASDFIHNNLLNPELNMDSLTRHLNYSRSYIMRTFKKEIGISVHEYILRSKIDYACELLANYSITDTAYLLNFSSSQHFSTLFKTYIDMTPGEYIRSLHGQE